MAAPSVGRPETAVSLRKGSIRKGVGSRKGRVKAAAGISADTVVLPLPLTALAEAASISSDNPGAKVALTRVSR